MRKFDNAKVEEKFLMFPEDRRDYLFHLRDLIFNVAESDQRIGPLSEELRWGDPSYITAKTNAGSTVRLGMFGRSKVALYFNCKTTLVEDFRTIYSDTLEYSKNRAILMDPHASPNNEVIQQCVKASLLYKLNASKAKYKAPS